MTASKIMVVEDEGIVGLELSEALTRMGYKVLPVVATGREALEKVVAEHPDLILMDIRLEGEIDGVETAGKIHNNFNIPIIYLTAHSDETTIQRAKHTETYGYLLKPFEERALRAAIEVALFKAQKENEKDKAHQWDETIIRNLPHAIVISDEKGLIKYMNQSASRLFNIPKQECTGKPLNSMLTAISPVTKDPVALPFTQMIIEENPCITDHIHILSRDQEIPAEYTMSPLKNRNNNTIGIITLFRTLEEKEEQEEAIRFELERSKQYQINLLPKKGHSLQGIASHWIFHPSIFGSGDIFNVFPISDSKVGFYLLDVMGHGFSAAVLSITIHSFLSHEIGIQKNRKFASEPATSISSPAMVIKELNKRFYFEANNNPFFTLVYGTIDSKAKKGVIARAGHLYPLLFKSGQKFQHLKSEGHAIGVFPDIDVSEVEFDFHEKDRLMLFSDGLLDCMGSGEEFSDETLITLLTENRNKSIEGICEAVDRKIQQIHPNPEFDDDIAFLILEHEAVEEM
ncbi:MAG: SpoIIE family protein phosphatase [Spirochaetales bacterium]|nr:SpoIIE family protein phosphatase [Spirochaetales bacterium]